MAQHTNLYAVLGVSKDADKGAIKRAYRKLAKQNHPDTNPGNEKAEARFKEISAAYEVLSSEERRALYDEFGEESLRQGFDADQARAWKQAQQQGGFGGFGAGNRGFGGGNPFAGGAGFGGGQGFDPGDLFGDLFGNMRGGGGRSASPQAAFRGEALRAQVTLDFEAAARGEQRELFFQDGKKLKVKIPSGVEDGETLRLRGKGNPGHQGGAAGDLLLTIHVAEHPRYRREGLDLHVDLPITVKEAVLGAKIPVATLGGEVTLTIPKGAQSGQKLRLRKKGIARKNRGHGDMYVHLQVQVPQGDSAELREALDAIEAAYGSDHPRGQSASRVREAA